jgi:hypothetical protein
VVACGVDTVVTVGWGVGGEGVVGVGRGMVTIGGVSMVGGIGGVTMVARNIGVDGGIMGGLNVGVGVVGGGGGDLMGGSDWDGEMCTGGVESVVSGGVGGRDGDTFGGDVAVTAGDGAVVGADLFLVGVRVGVAVFVLAVLVLAVVLIGVAVVGEPSVQAWGGHADGEDGGQEDQCIHSWLSSVIPGPYSVSTFKLAYSRLKPLLARPVRSCVTPCAPGDHPVCYKLRHRGSQPWTTGP